MPNSNTPTTRIEALNWPEVQKAVKGFIIKYSVPSLPSNAVLWGNQPRAALPNTDELIIITSISQSRNGTTISAFKAEDGTTHHKELVTEDLQVDFYSHGREGHDRAACIEMLARSGVASDYFKQFNMSCLFADEIRETAETIDAAQYVQRSILTLHVCYWIEVAHEQDWFDSVNVNIKNVDVYFPPEN